MKISLDFDGVLADLVGAVLRLALERRVPHGPWLFYKPPPSLEPLVKEMMGKPDLASRVRPYPESRHVVRALADQGHELVVITGRPKAIAEVTRQQVSQYFPEIQKVQFSGPLPDQKLKAIRDLGVRIHVDDNPEVVYHLLSQGAESILVVRDYNLWESKVQVPSVLLADLPEEVEALSTEGQPSSSAA